LAFLVFKLYLFNNYSFTFFFPKEKSNKKELVAVATPLKIISVLLNDFKLAALKQKIVFDAPLQ